MIVGASAVIGRFDTARIIFQCSVFQFQYDHLINQALFLVLDIIRSVETVVNYISNGTFWFPVSK